MRKAFNGHTLWIRGEPAYTVRVGFFISSHPPNRIRLHAVYL